MSKNITPLEALRSKILSHSLPSLGALIQFFSSTEEYLDFVRIVRELLPERETEILSEALPYEQIREFAEHFKTRYFPLEDSILWDMEDCSYRDFLRIIPVSVYGMTYEEYHDIPQDVRPGMLLLTYLFDNPYEEEDDGARVALAEMCAEHVPVEILQAVPEGGLHYPDDEHIFKGTRFEAVWSWGKYLNNDTGNFFLDTDYDYLYSGYGAIDWEKDTIDELTRQWLQHEQLTQEHVRIAEWLEKDPAKHFQELVDFINKRERRKR